MTHTFMLCSHARFNRILVFVILLHLIFLIGLDHFPQSEVSTLNRKMATLFEVSALKQANQRSPKIAINIAPHNHESPILKDLKEPPQKTPTLQQMGAAQVSPPTPRTRIISAASHEAKDAEYLGKWQTYMEKYGNSHYPQTALKNNLQGNVRLLVAINRDGTLREVSIRQSSGEPILDQAAINIVLKAAPFDPLPPELAKEIDVLEIIRTWQFRGKGTLYPVS